MMLKKRELSEAQALYELMVHPDVFPFVRHKAYSYEEFLFLTKQTIDLEEKGELISRTILNEWGLPIGTISLFDIEDQSGFLGTWIGQPYFGKGYNKMAKEWFFEELFFSKDIKNVFMRIRKLNTRSCKAALKLPYVSLANETHKKIYDSVNYIDDIYDLFIISKDQYNLQSLREFHNSEHFIKNKEEA